jgi:hypothetical protein
VSARWEIRSEAEHGLLRLDLIRLSYTDAKLVINLGLVDPTDQLAVASVARRVARETAGALGFSRVIAELKSGAK